MTNLDDLNNLAAMILAASCEKDEYLVSKKRDPNKERTSFYNATKRSYSSLTSNMTGGVTKYYNYKNNKEISWANDTYNHFSDGENINYLLDIMMPEERPSTSFLNNVGHLALFEYFILDYTNQHYYLAICYILFIKLTQYYFCFGLPYFFPSYIFCFFIESCRPKF